MIHPDTELKFISPEVGYGVVAKKRIPKGTITWILDKLDRSFSPASIETMDEVYQDILKKYSFRDNRGQFILCWDISRYVNHSFNSNCISTPYDFEIAVRDIMPGEELTDDYGYLNVTEPFDCLPEAGTNRTRVLPDDIVHFHKDWEGKLAAAFPYFLSIEQPLAFLIDPKHKAKVEKVAKGIEPMDSLMNCYYQPELVERR